MALSAPNNITKTDGSVDDLVVKRHLGEVVDVLKGLVQPEIAAITATTATIGSSFSQSEVQALADRIKLLEQQNADLLAMLKKAGINGGKI